jgi:hypothetical protein
MVFPGKRYQGFGVNRLSFSDFLIMRANLKCDGDYIVHGPQGGMFKAYLVPANME